MHARGSYPIPVEPAKPFPYRQLSRSLRRQRNSRSACPSVKRQKNRIVSVVLPTKTIVPFVNVPTSSVGIAEGAPTLRIPSKPRRGINVVISKRVGGLSSNDPLPDVSGRSMRRFLDQEGYHAVGEIELRGERRWRPTVICPVTWLPGFEVRRSASCIKPNDLRPRRQETPIGLLET